MNPTSITRSKPTILLVVGVSTLAVSILNSQAQNTNTSASSSSAKLPEVVVTGNEPAEARPGWLGEEQPVGENHQPEWTTRRRFTTTRVYVIAPWQVEYEQWWKSQLLRDGGRTTHLLQSEVELGLPYRFQVDLYGNFEKIPDVDFRYSGIQVEARWALADWGKIPLNPTLYAEWKFNEHAPDAYELKLLLGEELAPRWHWAFNIFYEQEVAGGRESEYGFAQGLSYTVIDEKFSAGVEMNFERRSSPNFDGKPEVEFTIGPSLQWRPTPRTHLDIVPLVGTTGDSPRLETFVVFGFDFGPGGNHNATHAPVSSMSR